MLFSFMKILVFSDSHSYIDLMEAAIGQEKPDHVLHLGDYERDYRQIRDKYPGIPMMNVAGNCDFGTDTPDTFLAKIAGIRIFMTHGHRYYVKSQYLRVVYAAQEENANVLLFGHTHRAECFREKDMWVMNPGAAGRRGTYGIIEIDGESVSCRLASIN